jgi:hypothetical protein
LEAFCLHQSTQCIPPISNPNTYGIDRSGLANAAQRDS